MTFIQRLMADIAAIASDIALLFQARVPAGGASGQALIKASGDDHDMAWGDVASGGSGGDTFDAGGVIVGDAGIQPSKFWRVQIRGYALPVQIYAMYLISPRSGKALTPVRVESPDTDPASLSPYDALVLGQGAWVSRSAVEGTPDEVTLYFEFEDAVLLGSASVYAVAGENDTPISTLWVGSTEAFGETPTAETSMSRDDFGFFSGDSTHKRNPALDANGHAVSGLLFDVEQFDVYGYGDTAYVGLKPLAPPYPALYAQPGVGETTHDFAARPDAASFPNSLAANIFTYNQTVTFENVGYFVADRLACVRLSDYTYNVASVARFPVPSRQTTVIDRKNPTAVLAKGVGDVVHAIYPMGEIAPASATDPGGFGAMTTDGGYLYICVGENQWKRVLLEAIP